MCARNEKDFGFVHDRISTYIHFAQFESCVIALLAGTNLHIINTMIVDNNGNNVALQDLQCLV